MWQGEHVFMECRVSGVCDADASLTREFCERFKRRTTIKTTPAHALSACFVCTSGMLELTHGRRLVLTSYSTWPRTLQITSSGLLMILPPMVLISCYEYPHREQAKRLAAWCRNFLYPVDKTKEGRVELEWNTPCWTSEVRRSRLFWCAHLSWTLVTTGPIDTEERQNIKHQPRPLLLSPSATEGW